MNKEEKKYPEDYTEEQQEQVKKVVIERLKKLPDNFRMAIG